jgi:hypothetical protein
MVGLSFGDWGTLRDPGVEPTSTLGEAVCLAFADSSRFFPNQSFRLSFSRFPDVFVESSVRQVIGGWISFLSEVAGDIKADLEVWSTAGDEALEIWLSLAPAGPDDSERFELKLLRHPCPQICGAGSDLRVCLRLPIAVSS